MRSLPSRLAIAACSSLFAFAASCKEPVTTQPKPPLEVTVTVTGDPGKPLKDAEIVYGGKTIATTDGKGVAKLTLRGNDGDSYDVSVHCPTGYQSPDKTITIQLVRTAQAPEYEAACPPTTRTVVVAIRADGGANLPVTYLGKTVARTDAGGAATVLLEKVQADQQFALTLDTSDKGADALRPKNPSNTFIVKRSDDVFTWDQKFTVEKQKPKYTGPTGPVRKGPAIIRTGGGADF